MFLKTVYENIKFNFNLENEWEWEGERDIGPTILWYAVCSRTETAKNGQYSSMAIIKDE